ncbi:MAG: hypothetical protein KJZ78_14570 [Bryobacteraceae bacterium]|nr:hypothetical protein [Bryobacteraceae bacterium]
MTRRKAISAMTAYAALGISRARQQTPAFRADVRLITVDVLAQKRASGKPLELLGPKDFLLLDDGNRREIVFFEIEATPLDIVFVPYLAGQLSTVKDYNAFIGGWRAAFAAFRDQDRAGLVRSLRDADNVALTEDRDRVRDAIRRPSGRAYPPVGYGARLYDTLCLAATLFPAAAGDRRRRAVIAITDDAEKDSKASIEDLTRAFLTADCTLNIVLLATAIHRRLTIGYGWPVHPGRRNGNRPSGPDSKNLRALSVGFLRRSQRRAGISHAYHPFERGSK